MESTASPDGADVGPRATQGADDPAALTSWAADVLCAATEHTSSATAPWSGARSNPRCCTLVRESGNGDGDSIACHSTKRPAVGGAVKEFDATL